jgi:DNA helicase-2/ATP-dependent DNA helicase PcrA
VIVAGLSEKIFPSARALEERLQKALEEERRLCYVAMTRAKKQLFMTESEGIGFKGYAKTPSRFLFDINNAYITRTGSSISSEIMEEHKIQTVIRNPYKDAHLSVGTAVKHKIFGEGIIESVDIKTSSYIVRFLIGEKPVRFDYRNMWKLM